MTDQWVPGPPPVPTPPIAPLPGANSWNSIEACSIGPNQPSITNGIVITGVPATIVAPKAWGITLNDGSGPPNFTIDHYDNMGALIDSPVEISGVNGTVTFNDPVVAGNLTAANLLVTPGNLLVTDETHFRMGGGAAGYYLSTNGIGALQWLPLPIAADAPSDGTIYGRMGGAWTQVSAQFVPITGGMFTGNVTLAGTTLVTGPGLQMIGNAVLSVPSGPSQFQLGGGSNGWFLTTNGLGALAWTAPNWVPASGGTFTGPVTFPSNNSVAINGAPQTPHAILGQVAGITRWQMQLGDATPEGANNAGSNFALSAFGLTGGFLGTWLTIYRADGLTTFNGSGVVVTGSLSVNGQIVLTDPTHLWLGGGAAGQFLQTNGAGNLTWQDPPGAPGGAVPEAPSDGTTYGRNDGAWIHVLPSSGGTLTGNLTISAGGLSITGGVLNCINLSATGAMTTQTLMVNGNAAFLGAVTLANPPTAGTDATNKAYVDGLAGTTTPLMNGTAAVGVGTTWARTDHVHPTDTTRYAASNPSGYQTAAQVAAVLPPASTTLPLPSGVAAIGVGTTYARADHVHPTTAIGDNRIINGDMRIDQRNAGASMAGTAISLYTVDRWVYQLSTTNGTWGRNLNSVVGPLGFPYYLGFQTSPAHTATAAQAYQIYQPIEADMVSDFQWGTVNAQPVTLQFWARSSLTGSFSAALQNYAGTRSYPFSFSLPTANTWTQIAVIIPGDTAGTWAMSGNGASIIVGFDLGSGANLRGPANAWAAANYTGVTGAVSVVATLNATFYLTGVKLEIGSVATPFNRQSLAKSMADCQRYYQVWGAVGGAIFCSGYGQAGATVWTPITLQTAMRAAPTIVYSNTSAGNASGINTNSVSSSSVVNSCVITATGVGWVSGILSLSAEL